MKRKLCERGKDGFKDLNARLTPVPLKPLSDQKCGNIVVFLGLKLLIKIIPAVEMRKSLL